MTAFVGVAIMLLAFVAAVRLTRRSKLAHRACASLGMGSGALLLMADTLRPDLLPLGLASLGVTLLWLALVPDEITLLPTQKDSHE